MKIRQIGGLVTTVLVLAMSTASATVVQGNGLQNGLNARTFDSNGNSVDFYDVNTSQVSGDELWSLSATGITANRLLFEFAGYKNINAFGIYDVNNPGNRLEIFSGGDGAGAFEILVDTGGAIMSLVNGQMTTFSSDVFGYYLSSPDGMFYSQSALNPGGVDHMVAFQGQGDLYLNSFGDSQGLFTSGEYILAWEDLIYTRSDRDFSDFVVMVESVTPVPAPAALSLLGLALFGLGVARRRA